ncbi:hypothetical protein A3A67_02780 [Candidatus Peribacteria bacterium RIFCSPLOWO2_01_FULL_51_18]|nr:MAG: hypothetical protein A3C52_03395 [Candidatus Peribacteria bacterium RIFCSPHIGHO2_02_FULL_51_15]OGJ66483.1 MAG: hypothetical protein A3A67_02780 [Candidatus Peribacteria bacterium RIFCSPLOWO2_01_FULL_51_18]
MTKLLTVPNLISASRLPLAVLVVISLNSPWKYAFFALAVLSDYLDGAVARRWRWASSAGGFIDPLFDKIFVLIVFPALLVVLRLPLYYALIFFARDIFTVMGIALFRRRLPAIKARFLGKLVTCMQFVALVSLLTQHGSFIRISMALLALLTIVSIVDYSWSFAIGNRRPLGSSVP